MSSAPLRLLILGAHPDDAEYHAGGLAAIYREAGHVVKMVSVTDGQSGHFRISGKELADIRRQYFPGLHQSAQRRVLRLHHDFRRL